MSLFSGYFAKLAKKDQATLRSATLGWASSIPGTVRIAEAPLRERVKLAGAVRRISVLPIEGIRSLEATLTDGTGEVNVVFMGRRNIEGMTLGTRVVVEGVIGEQRKVKRIVNPRFEFTS
jgi:RecG-like helicase